MITRQSRGPSAEVTPTSRASSSGSNCIIYAGVAANLTTVRGVQMSTIKPNRKMFEYLPIFLGIAASLVAGLLSFAIGPLTADTGYSSTVTTVLLLAGIGATIFAFACPINLLPSAVLLVFALVPKRLLPDVLGDFHPAAIMIVVWALRVAFIRRDRTRSMLLREKSTAAAAVLMVAWLAVSTIFALDKPVSLGWTMTFAICVLIPVFIPMEVKARENLLAIWRWIGAALGALGVVELATSRNVLFGYIYDVVGSDGQHWDSYRATMTFGHPLFAGMFLACSSALAVAYWFREHSKMAVLVVLGNVGGLVSTLSRGGLLALAIAATFGLLYLVVTTEGKRGRALLLGLAGSLGATAFLALNPAILSRFASDEASGSLTQRLRTITIATDQAQLLPLTGAGPGNSALGIGNAIVSLRYIENSSLQVLLGAGFVGVAVFVIILVLALRNAWRLRDLDGLMLLTAFAVAIGTYNAIDDQRATMAILGLVLFATARHGHNESFSVPELNGRLERATSRFE